MQNVDGPNYKMLLQVHDSIVGEARVSELEQVTHDVQREMSSVMAEKDFGVTFSTEADFWGPKR
jgi:DNA polymerase I-like protein with 3'-5' exonuclease and polymerase domains